MDDTFLREIIVLAGIAAVFLGSIPALMKGHHATAIDIGSGTARGIASGGEVETAEVGVKVSRKRIARARDAARKPG